MTDRDCFALLDDRNASAVRPTSRLYTGFVREHRCTDPATLDETCAAAERDLRAGLHAVLLADYEWGAKLLHAGHRGLADDDSSSLRLLMFERLSHLSRSQVDDWLQQCDDGRATPSPAGVNELRASVDHAGFHRAIARIHEVIGAGETYQVNYASTAWPAARRWGCTAAFARASRCPMGPSSHCRPMPGRARRGMCCPARPSCSCVTTAGC